MPLSSSINDNSYLYICNGDTCKKIKVSQDVHDFVDLMKQGKEEPKHKLKAYSLQALADLNKSKACIYPKKISYDFRDEPQQNTIKLIDHINN